MLDSHDFLRNLALVLCVAAVASFLFQRFRQPVVFGYLLAGMIIGPHIPIPLVADEGMVHTLAELGVVLLLFALGLEFSLRKLLQVGPTAGLIAVIQCSGMVFLGYLVGQLFGWTTLESIYAGAIIAISSTTIIVKAFAEQKVTGRLKELVFGVLIIEDLIGIFLLAILTTVSSGDGIAAGTLARTAMQLSAFLAGLIIVGLLVVPRFIRATVRLDRPEITLLAAVGLGFAAALLALEFGYSVALGAFIAGSLIAESGEVETIEHLVAPVRDLFGAIFFVAVGMLIDPEVIVEHWRAVVVFTVIIIIGKIAMVSVGAFLTGFGTRTSVQAGMSLAQIGEFSFIIAGIGLSTGATRGFLYPVAVAASAITTLTTPWLIRASGPAASYIDRKLPRPLQTFAGLYETWLARLREPTPKGQRSRVRRLIWLLLLDAALLALLVIGVAVEFEALVSFVTSSLAIKPDYAGIGVIIGAFALSLPLLFGVFRTVQSLGVALAIEVLPAVAPGKVDLGMAPRRALALALELGVVCVLGIPFLAITQPFLPPLRGPIVFLIVIAVLGIALWRSAANLHGHTRAGAEIIVAALSRQMASESTESASAGQPAPATVLADVSRLLPGFGEPVAFTVGAAAYAAGRSLRKLDVRSLTGVSILAVQRGSDQLLLPVGREVLQAGDILVLAGTDAGIRDATQLLQAGPE